MVVGVARKTVGEADAKVAVIGDPRIWRTCNCRLASFGQTHFDCFRDHEFRQISGSFELVRLVFVNRVCIAV